MDPLHHSNQEFNHSEPTYDQPISVLDAATKEKHARLFRRGLLFLAVGVSMLGMSFCVNYCLFHSEQSFTVIMYTMTTIGSGLVLKGMGDILGF